mmetsp:Transcript_8896/g.11337  ORF Transcript_8896/g.11337 Transcript_8896/m.11337 type:complete len:128 (+) Transcript_8896:408-791(+)
MPPGAVQITFVRHGEGIHNVLAAQAIAAGAKKALFTPDRVTELAHLIDAPLTEKGCQEARSNHSAAKALRPQPELMIVSPLQRATETGLLVFEHCVASRGGGGQQPSTDRSFCPRRMSGMLSRAVYH